MKREKWTSNLGVMLAVAGSAVGFGNFLRFPSVFAQNGGGVIFIPYFIGLLIIGIPLCLLEWAMGRIGSMHNHGTTPGIYNEIIKKPWAKYIGSIGIFMPTIVGFFYIYIESFLLGYIGYSLFHLFNFNSSADQIVQFFADYSSLKLKIFGIPSAGIFFAITLVINFVIISLGIQKGIEKISKILMPVLFVISTIMLIRVLTLPNIGEGLKYIFTFDFSRLSDPDLWFDAFSQIFFTLNVGFGVIMVYASYTKKENDLLKSTTNAIIMNEITEVIFALIIVLPIAIVALGATGATEIANSGTYTMGFVTMPLVLQTLPFASFFQNLWFILLFFAGLTSTLSMVQPVSSFLEDEFKLNKKESSSILFVVFGFVGLLCMFGFNIGIVDEMDFWAGQFFMFLAAIFMSMVFSFKMDANKTWATLEIGSTRKVPAFLKFITKYVTPTALIFLMSLWLIDGGFTQLGLDKYTNELVSFVGFEITQKHLVVLTRIVLFGALILCNFLVYLSFKKKNLNKG